jgi:hypothetical protein
MDIYCAAGLLKPEFFDFKDMTVGIDDDGAVDVVPVDVHPEIF